jgi:glucokinase
VDADRSVVLFTPNLAWRDEPLRDAVAQRLVLGGSQPPGT